MKFILLCILLFACSFSGNAIHFFNGTYEEALQLAKKEKKNLFISFTASWCGPCRMLGPVIEQLDNQYPDVVVGKVNVDDEQELAMRYGVMSIPTVIFFKDGKEIDRKVGVMPPEAFVQVLEANK